MNSDKLLAIALTMGQDASLRSIACFCPELKEVVIGAKGITAHDNVFNPEENDVQWKEVLEWFLTKGYIELTTQHSIEFTLLNGPQFTALEDNLTANILEIAWQVAEYINDDKG